MTFIKDVSNTIKSQACQNRSASNIATLGAIFIVCIIAYISALAFAFENPDPDGQHGWTGFWAPHRGKKMTIVLTTGVVITFAASLISKYMSLCEMYNMQETINQLTMRVLPRAPEQKPKIEIQAPVHLNTQ